MLDATARDGGRRGAAALRVSLDGQVADPISEADHAAPASSVSEASTSQSRSASKGPSPIKNFCCEESLGALSGVPFLCPSKASGQSAAMPQMRQCWV